MVSYGVESEMGQLEAGAHKVINGNIVEFDSRCDLFEETASRERFKSSNFKELALDFAVTMSDRKAASVLNRIRREPGGIIPTTLRNNVEREGIAIQRKKEELAVEALLANGFTADGELTQPEKVVIDEPRHIEHEIVQKAAKALDIESFTPSDYEDLETSVNVSIDDVGVKRQSEMRPKDEEKEQAKRVNNTVIHVQHGDQKCLINSSSVPSAIKLLLGLLLSGEMLGKQLVFFSDGARDIHSWINKLFAFAEFKIILDWYHLCKKCREQMSMIMYGSKARNTFLDKLLPCLWLGNVDGAIKLINELELKQVRNQDLLMKLIEYLNRVREYIPNYGLRKEIGLRNSSNLGEKANDLLVANRQKHNGMSWSNSGSLAFASVTASIYNGELPQFVHNGSVSLQMTLAA
jgi:hypothetical protein